MGKVVAVGVDGLHILNDGLDLGLAKLVGPVALCPHVGFFNLVGVTDLDGSYAHGSKLEGHLPTDGPNAHDEDVGTEEVLRVDDTGVSQETFASCCF